MLPLVANTRGSDFVCTKEMSTKSISSVDRISDIVIEQDIIAKQKDPQLLEAPSINCSSHNVAKQPAFNLPESIFGCDITAAQKYTDNVRLAQSISEFFATSSAYIPNLNLKTPCFEASEAHRSKILPTNTGTEVMFPPVTPGPSFQFPSLMYSPPHSEKDMSATETSETGYSCQRCGKVFSYQYYRDKHLKYTKCVDMGDRKYPCHLCARSFEKRDRLRIHVLHVHDKHRPHSCNVCGKRFSQSSSLNKHLRVHSGERPYKCVYCGKAFTASSILRTHIRQHSGEKPFKCKFCGKCFASHAAHDSHVRRTHPVEMNTISTPAPEISAVVARCPVCLKDFNQLSQLRYHIQCFHPKYPSSESIS